MPNKQTYQQEEQIRRYLQNRLTDTERNSFEREMQRDPFLAEAVEGFSSFSSEEILADIQALKAQVQKGKHSNRRYIWYAAASVLVIVISTFILFNLEEKTTRTLTENSLKVEPKALPEAKEQPKHEIPIAREQTKLLRSTTERKSNLSSSAVNELDGTDADQPIVSPEQPINGEESLVQSPTTEAEQIQEVAAIPEKIETVMKSPDNGGNVAKKISGVVTDSSGRPIAGATVFIKGTAKGTITDQDGKYVVSAAPDSSSLVFSFIGMKPEEVPVENKDQMDVALKEDNLALSEVVVVGYGVQKKANIRGWGSPVKSKQVFDGKATPVGGWEAFNEYLKTELQTPKIGSPAEKTTVKLSFVVSSTGNKEQFNILKGENDQYNEEAIRIIKDGPAWIPEIKNGKPEISIVELRLDFQPTVK